MPRLSRQRRRSNVKKGTRIGRRDILRGMARSRVRILDLRKAGSYSKQDYDGHSSEELQPGQGRCRSRGVPAA